MGSSVFSDIRNMIASSVTQVSARCSRREKSQLRRRGNVSSVRRLAVDKKIEAARNAIYLTSVKDRYLRLWEIKTALSTHAVGLP